MSEIRIHSRRTNYVDRDNFDDYDDDIDAQHSQLSDKEHILRMEAKPAAFYAMERLKERFFSSSQSMAYELNTESGQYIEEQALQTIIEQFADEENRTNAATQAVQFLKDAALKYGSNEDDFDDFLERFMDSLYKYREKQFQFLAYQDKTKLIQSAFIADVAAIVEQCENF